jgi:hypothetical protein
VVAVAAVIVAGDLLEQAPEGTLSDRLSWCLAQGAYSEADRKVMRDGIDAALGQEAHR